MANNDPIPTNLRLRYGTASVFQQPDVHSPHVAELAQTDSFTVTGTDGDFYRVTLPDGAVGYIYAHNVTGTDLPLTDRERADADERAALAARPATGWRGMMNRVLRNR